MVSSERHQFYPPSCFPFLTSCQQLGDSVQDTHSANIYVEQLPEIWEAHESLKSKLGHSSRCRTLLFPSLTKYVLWHPGINNSKLKLSILDYWKPYYKRFHFDPLKCMAGLNVQCKKDWCEGIWTLRTQEERGLAPPPTLSTPLPHSPQVPIEGSVYHQPETRVDGSWHRRRVPSK